MPYRQAAGGLTLLLSLCILLPTPVLAGRQTVSSTLGEHTITIDGSAADWDGFETLYLPSSVRVLAVAHVSDSLYVMFRFGDRRLARQIFHGGVTVWINGDAKAKESFGVRYWGSFELAEDVDPTLRKDQEQLPEELRRRLGLPPQTDRITLIRDDRTRNLTSEEIPGLAVSSAVHEGGYTYEMSVPFSVIGGKVADRDPDRKRSVRIGLELSELPADEAAALRRADPAPAGAVSNPAIDGSMSQGAPATESVRSDGVTAPGPVGMRGAPPGAAGRWLPSVDNSVRWLEVTLPAAG